MRLSHERTALSLVEKPVARLTGFLQSHRRLFRLCRCRRSEAATITPRHPANALVGTFSWVSWRSGSVCWTEARQSGWRGHLHRTQRHRSAHYVHRY
ncbi:MAG: hypothetical protein PUP92_21390 [Rhizonema sp. PD38]|nr:hypothetical protein [Rhizonema sp. PD38]